MTTQSRTATVVRWAGIVARVLTFIAFGYAAEYRLVPYFSDDPWVRLALFGAGAFFGVIVMVVLMLDGYAGGYRDAEEDGLDTG